MATYTWNELLKKVNLDFGVALSVEKEKAGYLMLSQGGTLGNWDCGHSCPSTQSYVELPNGWAYVLLNETWYRARDGKYGWRQGVESAAGAAYPDMPAASSK